MLKVRTKMTEFEIIKDDNDPRIQFCFVYLLDDDTPKAAIVLKTSLWDNYFYTCYTQRGTNFLVVHKRYKRLAKACKAMHKEIKAKEYDLSFCDLPVELPPIITKLELKQWLDFA